MSCRALGVLVFGFVLVCGDSRAATAPTDAERAGRAVFIELKCTACHRVLGDEGLPAPVTNEAAPILGGLNAVHTYDDLLVAIHKPSHSFAPGFHPTPSGESRMGVMNDSMTTQQLMDIATYLKGQEDSGAGWKKEQENT